MKLHLPIFHYKATKFKNSFTIEVERNNVFKSEKHNFLNIPKMKSYKSVSAFINLSCFSKSITLIVFLVCEHLLFSQSAEIKLLPPYPFKGDIQQSANVIDRINDLMVAGLYIDSYKISDSLRDALTITTWLTKEDSSAIMQGEIKPAIPFLAELAKDIDILLVSGMNEDPKARAFTTALLPRLKNTGFTHFSAETILDSFSFSTTRKYPIIKDSSIISFPENYRDIYNPIYAEMLRTAGSINFETFTYEPDVDFETVTKKENGSYRKESKGGKYFVEMIVDGNSAIEKSNFNRDSIQAINIAAFFKIHPKAKVVIYVEPGAAQKREGSMRNYLSKILPQKNIISVFQYIVGSRYLDTLGDNPIVKMRNIKAPSVIVGKDNKEHYLRGEDNTDFVDYHIIHPSTKWVNDRPSWLSTYLGRKAFQVTRTLNRMDGGCPCKVAVYNHNELIYGFNKAIPIDIIEVANRQEFTNAYLIAGEGLFTVLSWNKAGKSILDYYSIRND